MKTLLPFLCLLLPLVVHGDEIYSFHSFQGSFLWGDTANWPSWNPTTHYDIPYPTTYHTDLGIRRNVSVNLTGLVSIDSNASPWVMNVNMAAGSELGIVGKLGVGGGNLASGKPVLTFQHSVGIWGTPNTGFSAPGVLVFQSNTTDSPLYGFAFLGSEEVTIPEGISLTLSKQGARIYNFDNLNSDVANGDEYAWDLTERVRHNSGVFSIYDRTWTPAPPAKSEGPGTDRLVNEGTLRIEAYESNTVVALDGQKGPLTTNHGNIIIEAAQGLTATLDTSGIPEIPANTSIQLNGSGARLGNANDALRSLTFLRGDLSFTTGATHDVGNNHLFISGAAPTEANPYPLTAYLSVRDDDSAFTCGNLDLVKGDADVNDFRPNLVDQYLPGSASFETVGGNLSAPAYRALDGHFSHDLASAAASFSMVTQPGKTYRISFGTYGGLEARDGVVTVFSDNMGIPDQTTFSAPATASFATAAYVTRELTFQAVDYFTTISFSAADPMLTGVGPVIDSVQVRDISPRTTAAINVTGALKIYADVYDQSGFAQSGGFLYVGGSVHAGSFDVKGPIDLENGVLNGIGGSQTFIDVGSSGAIYGNGEVYCNNLTVSGMLFPGPEEDELGSRPLRPLTVHGKVTMQSGSVFWVSPLAQACAALHVVPGGAGDGSIVLNGRLQVEFLEANPPLPSEVFIIISASSITGTFDNIVNGRVYATDGNYGNGSFAVTMTGTTVTLSDFSFTEPIYTLASWAQQQGVPAGSSGPDGDPDHDGLRNVIEYALNTSPVRSDQTENSLPLLDLTSSETVTGPVYRYRRPAGVLARPDIIYTVEFSPDLIHWTPANGSSATITRISAEEDEVSVPIPSPNQFARLDVTSP